LQGEEDGYVQAVRLLLVLLMMSPLVLAAGAAPGGAPAARTDRSPAEPRGGRQAWAAAARARWSVRRQSAYCKEILADKKGERHRVPPQAGADHVLQELQGRRRPLEHCIVRVLHVQENKSGR